MRIKSKKSSDLESRERKAHLLDEISELYHENTLFLRIFSPSELYNSFDPAPESERELSDGVEEYIFTELEHKRSKARIGVTFVTDDESLFDIETVKSAFANHFKIRAEEQIIKNRKAISYWIKKLLMGLAALCGFLFVAHFLRQNSSGHPLFSILGEGLGVVGWVALWEPASYFLYGRIEERRLLMDYMRLHRAEVKIESVADFEARNKA